MCRSELTWTGEISGTEKPENIVNKEAINQSERGWKKGEGL